MLKNYISIILRQFWKNKIYSIINVFGLALGMSICFIIAQYVNFYRSFDDFHTKGSQIYRIENQSFVSGNYESINKGNPGQLGVAIKEQLPQVVEQTRIRDLNYLNPALSYLGGKDETSVKQEGLYALEPSLFEIFDFKFLAGSAEKFSETHTMILTKKVANIYFDDFQKAIGETINFETNGGTQAYELIGILDEIPANSHLKFNVGLSFRTLEYFGAEPDYNSWEVFTYYSYVLLNKEAQKESVETQINQVFDDNTKVLYADKGVDYEFTLLPLADIHLSERSYSDFVPHVNGQIILILSIIAIVILVIAWINYLNLSLVRTMDRMKELGVRKYLGSNEKQLLGLFLLEAFMMNLGAILLSLVFINLSTDYLSQVTGLDLLLLNSQQAILTMTILVVAGTLAIGFYPMVLIKGVKTVNILIAKKGKKVGVLSRKSMILAQFVVTFMLIAATYTIYNQVNYMREADLGIQIDNVLMVEAPPENINDDERQTTDQFQAMSAELLKYPNIIDVTNAGEIPGKPISWGASLNLKNKPKETAISSKLLAMNTNFPEFFDIDVVAGRALREGDDPWSKGDVVINVELAEQLGFADPQDAVGAEIDGFFAPLQVRGVLENHHQTSLHNDYTPIAYIISGWTRYYFYKLRIDENSSQSKSDQLASMIQTIQSEWEGVFPNFPMEYSFVDQAFDQQYQEDFRFGKLFTGFSVVAILIACLGLFGLTSLTVNQRIKEIGIRKVLGARVSHLISILAKEYVWLIVLSGVIGLPIAWLIMNQWLEAYSFRIDLGVLFFLIPIVIVFGLALFCVIGKISQVAQSNPINALRDE